MRKLFLAFLLIHPATAQTRPHPYQVNKEQVRIYPGDSRPGTLVPVEQMQDGRHLKSSDQIVAEPPFSHVYQIICLITWFRIANEVYPERNQPGYTIRDETCLTDYGMSVYLAIPEWKAWYDVEVAKEAQ